MTRVAAIDCGTNSVRLLVAEPAPAGGTGGANPLHELHREMRIVRLGQDVDRTRRLAPEALARTRAALEDYAATIAAADVAHVRLVATSATRDATNRDEFTALVRDTLGIDPEVVSGTEEAALSFTGAVGTLPGLDGPVLLTDIGGGSTELVLGRVGAPLSSHSMDIGSVRMTERHLRDDPPSPAQVAAARADIEVALAEAARDVDLDTGAALVGVAGTVTTVLAVAIGLTEYDPARIHGARLSAATIDEVTDRLLRLDHAGRAAIPAIHPGRVDVIGAGALILQTLVRRIGATEVIVSEHDILDGIALALLRRDGASD